MQDLSKIDTSDMLYSVAKKLREECHTELSKTRNASSIRARLMGTASPEETARYLLLQNTIKKLDRRMHKIEKSRPIVLSSHEKWKRERLAAEDKYPEHQLEFKRTLIKGRGPSWVKVAVIPLEDEATKTVYRCSLCEEFFNDKENPYRRCRGKFKPGEQRELPRIKVGMTLEMGDDHWEVTEFLTNRISIIPHKLSKLFDSYLDIGQEYWMRKCCDDENFELWEITEAQMKRSTSQVIFSIIDGCPGTDLDS